MKENYKTCYIYSPDTGEFLRNSIAQLSPVDLDLGKEIYLQPEYSTFDPPPLPISGQAAVWREGKWIITPDYRGCIYYDTQTQEAHKITELEERPLESWTDIPPSDNESVWENGEWVVPFDILKARKILSIRAEADATLTSIKSEFSESEIISWSKQEAGTRDLLADPESETEDAVFIRNLSRARGIPLEELVEKIRRRFTEYYYIMAEVIGSQQRREDAAGRASTREELQST